MISDARSTGRDCRGFAANGKAPIEGAYQQPGEKTAARREGRPGRGRIGARSAGNENPGATSCQSSGRALPARPPADRRSSGENTRPNAADGSPGRGCPGRAPVPADSATRRRAPASGPSGMAPRRVPGMAPRRVPGMAPRRVPGMAPRQTPRSLHDLAAAGSLHRAEEDLHRQASSHPLRLAGFERQQQVTGMKLRGAQDVHQAQTDLHRPAGVDALQRLGERRNFGAPAESGHTLLARSARDTAAGDSEFHRRPPGSRIRRLPGGRGAASLIDVRDAAGSDMGLGWHGMPPFGGSYGPGDPY